MPCPCFFSDHSPLNSKSSSFLNVFIVYFTLCCSGNVFRLASLICPLTVLYPLILDLECPEAIPLSHNSQHSYDLRKLFFIKLKFKTHEYALTSAGYIKCISEFSKSLEESSKKQAEFVS